MLFSTDGLALTLLYISIGALKEIRIMPAANQSVSGY